MQLRLLGPEGKEIRLEHEHFTTDLDPLRKRGGEGARQIGQGFEVAGDVLAHRAVAAGGPAHEAPVLVQQVHREPVDLRLRHEAQHLLRPQSQEATDAGRELREIGGREGIVQAQHRRAVPHLAEARGWGGARRRIGRAVGSLESGKTRFDRGIAPPQRVVIRVRDLGRVLLVISNVGGRDRGGQRGQFRFGLGFAQRLDGRKGGEVGHARVGQVENDASGLPHSGRSECGKWVGSL